MGVARQLLGIPCLDQSKRREEASHAVFIRLVVLRSLMRKHKALPSPYRFPYFVNTMNSSLLAYQKRACQEETEGQNPAHTKKQKLQT